MLVKFLSDSYRGVLSEVLVFGSVAFLGFVDFLFLVFGFYRLFFQLLFCILVGVLVVGCLKFFFRKDRPSRVRSSFSFFSSSFPSMHSFIAALGFCFGFIVFSFFLWRVLIGFLLFLVLFASLFLGRHDKNDVVVGVVLAFFVFFVSNFLFF